jgi:hypothetical protein
MTPFLAIELGGGGESGSVGRPIGARGLGGNACLNEGNWGREKPSAYALLMGLGPA